MDHFLLKNLERFKDYVGIKFQLYNSLFTALPFHRIEKTGVLLSMLLNHCEEGYNKKESPEMIIEDFFNRFTTYTTDGEKIDLLFRFVQYAERQVVLFDALEDAAFNEITDINGIGSLKQLEALIAQDNLQPEMAKKLQDFSVRLVLTAHPTQFYPGSVLGIIHDLSKALKENKTARVNTYLQQLGKTPFLQKQKPTPYDEAVSLIWYLENVFYNAAGRIVSFLKAQLPEAINENHSIISMGFWPGGDRDGNPNVTAETTLKVADALRNSIIKCYYFDVRKLKRRLTFKGVEPLVAALESTLYNCLFSQDQQLTITKEEIKNDLIHIREIIVKEHNGLFVSMVEDLINKVSVFGLYFAVLDVRQDSSILTEVLKEVAQNESIIPANYSLLTEGEKTGVLTSISTQANPERYQNERTRDTFYSMKAIKTIQEINGEEGCNRYIISHCENALNMLEVYGLFLLSGWEKATLTVDIVPLFETIDDLKQAPYIMASLYKNESYRQHLQLRRNKQTIMVGFSDGTKDGGYLMANWSIYKAKEELTAISRQYGIEVVFFDGRGGPPARGGGKTHKFYASMGKNISTKEIHLTIQGQTVSSNFGTVETAQFNMEQLLNAGITNELFSANSKTLSEEQEQVLQELSNVSYEAYKELKNHSQFLNYLSHISPVKYYGETNIGSRPVKRGGSSQLSLKDLRAIPFVGSWSQIKQNVPGFYGVGTALEALEKRGKLPAISHLYQRSQYFKTLMDNCEMAMKKCFFPLTAFLADDPQYGEIWQMIFQEFERTQKYLFLMSGKSELMSDYPVDQLSIGMRERIVLPLTTIQQYAMARIREMEKKNDASKEKKLYEKLVVRTSFGIINAGRNSA
ncbi:MAG: phosphoenolpyruvate carboxylase [Chitinophagaceae bacterium]